MRVLHLIKTGIGAAWALRQIEVLIHEGVEVHVAIGEIGPMVDRYIAAGAIVHHVQVDIARIFRNGIKSIRSAVFDMRNLVSNIKPDVIHSHFVGTTLFARLALGRSSNTPLIFQVPGPLHLESMLPRAADLLSAGRNDYFIASCQLTRDIYLRKGVHRDRVYLSFYGTDVEAFSPVSPIPEIRDKIGVPRDADVVGMVAYMYPPKRFLGQRTGLKGHEDLIEAIGLLLDKGRNVYVIFVGGAWGAAHSYENRLKRLAKSRLKSNAILLGTRTDVRSLYQAFDLVAHPSHSENLGGAAESLLLGVPTIATKVGGFPDIVRHGQTGLLVPPNSPIALSEAIEILLDDRVRAKSMAREGRKLARELLNVRKTGREICEIYSDVLEIHSQTEPKL